MRYQYLSELGRGGFGTVYKAYNRSTGRFVAVKVLTRRNRPGEVGEMAIAQRGEGEILPQLDHVCAPFFPLYDRTRLTP
jgi:serine/threonine protein kinase